MAASARIGLALLIMAVAAAPKMAGQGPVNDRPTVLKPVRPLTQKEIDHREALKLYGQALLYARNNRLLEAAGIMEEALRLDPEAGSPRKALIPLYHTLDRTDDALAACKKTLDLDGDDYETWYWYARQLNDLRRPQEGIAAMARAAACPSLKQELEKWVKIHFDLGILYENSSEHAQAEKVFQQVRDVLLSSREALIESGACDDAQIDAELVKNYDHLGQACHQSGRHTQAAAAYERALKLAEDRIKDPIRADQFKYRLAEVNLAGGKPEKALAYLNDYLRSQPPGSEAYQLKITILGKLHREMEIIPAFERYAENDRHNVSLQLLLAGQYAKARRWDKAESLYQGIAGETPTADVYRGLFRLYRDQGAIEKILDLLDGTIGAAAPPGDKKHGDPVAAARARAMLAVLDEDAALVDRLIKIAVRRIGGPQKLEPPTRRFLAVLAARSKKLEAAEKIFRDCLESVSLQSEFDVYAGLIQVLWLEKKYPDILVVCRRGLKETQVTNRLLFHENLARVLLLLDRNDEALVEIDRSIALADDKNRVHYRLLRTRILAAADQNDKAVNECLALLKDAHAPEDIHDIRNNLSILYAAAHDYARAAEQLRLIIEVNPEDATAHNDLGYLMADKGKELPEAETLIRKAIDLDRRQKRVGNEVSPDDNKDHAAYIDSLGWVLFRQGHLEEARRELERALALPDGNEDPVIRDHLGDVYFRLDKPERARELWKKAVFQYENEKLRKLDDQYREIKHKLQLLDKP